MTLAPGSSILVNMLLGFMIGLSLGMLGGGGSILTVPALVYIVGVNSQAAITASLVIVGMNSAMGALMHRKQDTLNWKVALAFGGAGMTVAYLSAGLSRLDSSHMLMVLFALLMLLVGSLMIFRKAPAEDEQQRRGWLVTIASGAGVGGGFLIVPALVILIGLPMRQAVGTSLVIIAMNSLAGFLGHLNGPPVDWTIIALFVAAGFAGALAGARLVRRVNPALLRSAFGIFVIGLAIILLIDNLRHVL